MGIASIHPSAVFPFANKMILVDPSGQIIVNYLKSHPVAGWEASIMERGDGRVPIVATAAGKIASAICFDADFPEFVRQAGRSGAEILIVPANDSHGFKELHLQMAAFRRHRERNAARPRRGVRNFRPVRSVGAYPRHLRLLRTWRSHHDRPGSNRTDVDLVSTPWGFVRVVLCRVAHRVGRNNDPAPVNRALDDRAGGFVRHAPEKLICTPRS
jgi:Carbon-nitrogen hydrolase